MRVACLWRRAAKAAGVIAIIVLGGTFGATFISFPLHGVIKAFKDLGKVISMPAGKPEALIKDMIGYAAKARRNGLISLEQEAQTIKDPFTKRGISMVVDGIDPQKLREALEAAGASSLPPTA